MEEVKERAKFILRDYSIGEALAYEDKVKAELKLPDEDEESDEMG